MLKVDQTLTCDICGGVMINDTQIVRQGCEMYKIKVGPVGVTGWNDVCDECSEPLQKAVWALKTAKDAE